MARDASTGYELWAYDTSNQSLWQVKDFDNGSSNGYPGIGMIHLIGDTIYFDVDDGVSGRELHAFRPLSINYQTNTGGNVTTWAINASLPSGLTFSTTNGSIYGTPTELWTQTSYMVWANNSGGSSVAYINITVVDELPSITYTPENVILTNNTISSDLPLVPTISGSGNITSWALNNTSLPSGIQFGSDNGTLWGTPTELWNTTAYMVWANNSGGSVLVYFNLTVNDQLPTSLSYTPDGQNISINSLMTTMNPTLTGPGEITSWAIEPSLPSGVLFSSSNGSISGTPIELWTNTTYTIWANNSGGSIQTTIWLQVSLATPNIAYNATNVSLIVNSTSIQTIATNTCVPSGLIAEILNWVRSIATSGTPHIVPLLLENESPKGKFSSIAHDATSPAVEFAISGNSTP